MKIMADKICKQRITVTEEMKQQMIDMKEQGMSNKAIGEALGCSTSIVQRYLADAGYKRYKRVVHSETYREPDEIVGVPYTMQTRKPQVYDITIKGKKYKDITEIVGGI